MCVLTIPALFGDACAVGAMLDQRLDALEVVEEYGQLERRLVPQISHIDLGLCVPCRAI